jgi:hypothetical protein
MEKRQEINTNSDSDEEVWSEGSDSSLDEDKKVEKN